MPLEVFQAPTTLRGQLIEFQTRQQCYPLAELEQFCSKFWFNKTNYSNSIELSFLK